eukprot:SM000036S13243  [mRNA]  locus=s36:87267:89266:+ [translate_table: standard]
MQPMPRLLDAGCCCLPCTPSYAVDSDNGGGWVLDRVLASFGSSDWWATGTGRFRLQRLWSPGKRGLPPERAAAQDLDSLPGRLRRLADPSLYAFSARGRLLLGPALSMSAHGEVCRLAGLFPRLAKDESGDAGGHHPFRGRLTIKHKLKKHDVTVEAAWHERCVNREARYWDVPRVVALDLASMGAPLGFRYRLGVLRSSGVPQASESLQEAAVAVPWGALPGTRAQAALSVEREVFLWRDRSKREGRPYNLLAARPRLMLAGILGGLITADLSTLRKEFNSHQRLGDGGGGGGDGSHKPVAADLFSSLGVTAQLGLFKRQFLDHTSASLRLDLGAASAFAAAAASSPIGRHYTASNAATDPQKGCPTLALSVQQQVMGPIRARLDTRHALDSKGWLRAQEVTYGLDCSLETLGAAKLVVWYSPTRREGMAEVRLLEK